MLNPETERIKLPHATASHHIPYTLTSAFDTINHAPASGANFFYQAPSADLGGELESSTVLF